MQEFSKMNGGSLGNKVAPGVVEPTIGKPTYLNRDDDLMMEQYVTSLDNKLDEALSKAEDERKAHAAEKESWEKEREDLTKSRDDLADQLNALQMRQAQKASDEFNAYWAQKKKQAEDDSSSAAAALVQAEDHIKRLQEQNANLCYRLSEMRKDLAAASSQE
jgi:chromosome segregation ATPase